MTWGWSWWAAWWRMLTPPGRPKQPIPPTNVRLHVAGQRIIPLELVYHGVDGRGQHVWTNPVPLRVSRPATMTYDELPGRTTICLDFGQQ